jgi:hypothetical protein
MKKKYLKIVLIVICFILFGWYVYSSSQRVEQGYKGADETTKRVEKYSNQALKNGYNETSGGIGAKPVVVKKSDLEKDNIGQDDE